MPDKFGDKIRLQHALDATDKIQRYLKGIKKNDFLADDMTQDACIRQLQVIGESINRIQSRTQKPILIFPGQKLLASETWSCMNILVLMEKLFGALLKRIFL